jgi:hypothetical protein
MKTAQFFLIPFLFVACAYYEQDDNPYSNSGYSSPYGRYSSYYYDDYGYPSSSSSSKSAYRLMTCDCKQDRKSYTNTEVYNCFDSLWDLYCGEKKIAEEKFELKSCFKSNWADYDQMAEMTIDTLPGCKDKTCSPVPIMVNYLVDKDLGAVKSAVIEVYDNPLFIGSPVKQAFITDFDTARLGKRKGTFLGLHEGDYYLRAYIIDEQQRLPNWYKNPELKSGMPIGVLGAISTPKKISVPSQQGYVRNKMCPAQQMIDITQLVTDPDSELPTDAKLKIDLKTSEIQKIADHRAIKILLLASEQLNEKPLKEFSLPSEQLLISSRPGRASFVTANLETRTYYVFVYIDNNQNNLFDKDEPNSFYRFGSEIFPVVLRANETKSLEIEL